MLVVCEERNSGFKRLQEQIPQIRWHFSRSSHITQGSKRIQEKSLRKVRTYRKELTRKAVRTPKALCLVVREIMRAMLRTKTIKGYYHSLECLSKFEVKTLLLNTAHISDTKLRKVEVVLMRKFLPQGLVLVVFDSAVSASKGVKQSAV